MGGYGSDYDYSTDDSVVKRSAKSYNIAKGRDYTESKAAVPPPKDKVLITEAKFPIVVSVDVTGSMKTWPGIIFEKLCILYSETLFFLPEELKENFEISFAACGDAYSDSAPIQITDFAAGQELDANINSLYPEGGGGGQTRETYELIAYYYARKCEMPKISIKPLIIFVGDEGFYTKINRSHIMDLIGDKPKTDLIAKNIFKELKKKFSVYMLRIQYSSDEAEERIDKQWRDTLGDSNVIIMEDPRRIVDTILGIVATAVDGFDKFKERIEIRQTPEQVKQVYSSLNGIESETKKKYVYEIKALECPRCGAKLNDKPDYDHDVKCESCGYLIVRI
ncbi:MAG: hypothetical protein ACFFCS_09330 [Candidatus Hodarchaeota archaeon]